jgi:L-alanine-DL-glutamate epimerase-like enolase superfamily enzyme
MAMNRRDFLAAAGAAALLGGARRAQGAPAETEAWTPDYERPVFDLHRFFKSPVRIESLELLKNGRHYFVRSRSRDGAVGVARTKQVRHFIPILLDLVIPHFLGEDARDLEALVDKAYTANYKMAGQALCCPIAYVEQSLFDLLGKTTGKPVGELMGGVLRTRIPVYLSGSGRRLSAEEEVEVYVRGVERTGARAVKFKIGGRMSRNRDAYPGRTETLLERARQRLGDEVILYADANGSYNSVKAIEIGRRLEGLGFRLFEEPCPFEELGETQRVTEALDMAVAAGEQDSSLWRFQWMVDNGVMDIVQPDINYNGGFVRTARVARMARERNMPITPHNTQTGAAAVNMLHFASATPNIGPYMEFPWREPHEPESWYAPNFTVRNGVVKVPTGPGLGVEIDPDFLGRAERITV